MSKARINFGKHGEDMAVGFLEEKGFQIIQRNYRQKCGEVDIIAKDKGTLVFIEVKTRSSLRFGQPFEAVTTVKQVQLNRIALDYMTRNKITNQAARFDVISILLEKNREAKIEHLPDCF
ncbi:MAG: YraN family protein [Desulfocapsa sp.]|nr:MAG: YraN family protein [Desulfocapsa sp.]